MNQGLLFLTYKKPSPYSLSVGLPDRKTITKQVMPEDVIEAFGKANRSAERVLEKHLCRLGSLYFVGPPLAVRKPEVEAALSALDTDYATVKQLIIDRWDAVAGEMESFYSEYAEHIARRRSTALVPSWIERRFSPRWTWMPFELPDELRNQLFSPEEQARIRAEIEDQARAAVAAKVEGNLEDLVSALKTATAALAEDRVVNRKTIRRITEAYEELAKTIPHTPAADRYSSSLESFADVLEELSASRDAYDDTGHKDLTALRSCVETAMSKAQPMLDSFTIDFGEDVAATPGSTSIAVHQAEIADLMASLDAAAPVELLAPA